MIRGGFGHGEERPQVDRERRAAAAMLGLPGFVVLAVSEHDGELEQAIETTADLVGWWTRSANMADRAWTTRPDSPGCGRSGWTKPPSPPRRRRARPASSPAS